MADNARLEQPLNTVIEELIGLKGVVAALAERVGLGASDPLPDPVPVGPAVVLNPDGSVSVPEVSAFREKLRSAGDSVDREFADFIPDKFLVYDETRLASLEEETKRYVTLNVDRAGMQMLSLRTSGENAYTFSWIVHKVKYVKPFWRDAHWDFDMEAGQVMDTLAYPYGVTAESILARVQAKRAQFRRERNVDPNDFLPKV